MTETSVNTLTLTLAVLATLYGIAIIIVHRKTR